MKQLTRELPFLTLDELNKHINESEIIANTFKEARDCGGDTTVYANIDLRNGEINYDTYPSEDQFVVNLFEMNNESIGDLYADEDYLEPDDQDEYLKELEEDEPRWESFEEYLEHKGYDKEELENALFKDNTADFEINHDNIKETYGELLQDMPHVAFIGAFGENDLTVTIANNPQNDAVMIEAVHELTDYPSRVKQNENMDKLSSINDKYIEAGKKIEKDNSPNNKEHFTTVKNIKSMVDKAQRSLNKEHSKPIKQKSQELER